MTEVLDRKQKASAGRTLDRPSMHAAQVFRHMLGGRFSIKQVIAFGSRARGGHTSESDLDLAIVLDGPPGDRFAVVREMAGVAFDAMLETQILVDAVPIWLAEFDGLAPFSNPALIETIKTEGIVL